MYWNDMLGKKYQYGPNVSNYATINQNTTTVWFYTDNEDLHFWGFGTVENITTTEDNKHVAKMKDFHYFDEQHEPSSDQVPNAIKASPMLQQKIKKLPEWNPYNSIIKINESVYNQIL